MQNSKHTAVEAVASFLKERDENVLPGEADDEERKASAQCIVRVVAKFSSPTNLENAERAEMEPKVKPLEWTRSGWVEAFAQPDGLGFWYSISPEKPARGPGEPPFSLYVIWGVPGNSERKCLGSEFRTLDEAKAAAQSDFASRIRSCLLDKPEAVEGETVGYVSQYTLDEIMGGRFGNIYPKGTLVPENEIPLYRAATDGAEVARLRKALTEVGEWINDLPIPTTGATRMLGIVRTALTQEPTHEYRRPEGLGRAVAGDLSHPDHGRPRPSRRRRTGQPE